MSMQNTYVPKFTYIIPFRYTPDRIINLRRIIDWLSGFQGIDVLIVEQDKHSKISHLNMRARHLFIESSLPFNKSWAFNVALKRCTSPIVVCADADFIMDPNDLIQSLNAIDNCDCVIPTNNIVGLSPQESSIDTIRIINTKRPGFKANMTDGVVIFKRDALFRIGGWNEDIIGLGYENQFQDIKIMKLLNYKQLEFNGQHLYHEKLKSNEGLDNRNKQIVDFYKDVDVNKLQQNINTTGPKIGSLNKYQ